MSTERLILYIIVMAGVTYLIRMLPLALFQRKIESRFVRSFLYYVPYAVLGTMTFPAIFTSTGSVYSATVGLVIAMLLAVKQKGLLTVAVGACAVVLIVEGLMRLM